MLNEIKQALINLLNQLELGKPPIHIHLFYILLGLSDAYSYASHRELYFITALFVYSLVRADCLPLFTEYI